MQQEIQYCTMSDGVRLAYSVIGKGTPIVRTPHWFAHLENDLNGPIFRHQLLGLAHRHSLLRYDERNWLIKIIVILASIAGVTPFVEEVWRAFRH